MYCNRPTCYLTVMKMGETLPLTRRRNRREVKMRAGASVQPLRFPEGFFPTEGFTRQLDGLHARVLVIEGPARHAILVLELTSLPPEEVEGLRELLGQKTGAEHCHVLVTHTFSAPHFMPDHLLATERERANKRALRRLVQEAAGRAAQEAVDCLREARLSMGVSECGVATARDVETPLGWWIANNGPGPVDRRMTALRLADEADATIAVLVHYAVQPSVLDGSQMHAGGKAVSGDLAGCMASELEKGWGAPVLFLIGAAGDQAPRQKAKGFVVKDGALVETDMHDEAIPLLRAQAAEMADAAREAVQNARPMQESGCRYASAAVTLPGKRIERDLKKLHPTLEACYEPEGEREQRIELLCIGGLKLLGVAPELGCATAQAICSGDPMVRVVTLWNGGAKYLADARSYDRATYEAQNSFFARGGAERLAEAAAGLIGRMRD